MISYTSTPKEEKKLGCSEETGRNASLWGKNEDVRSQNKKERGACERKPMIVLQ